MNDKTQLHSPSPAVVPDFLAALDAPLPPRKIPRRRRMLRFFLLLAIFGFFGWTLLRGVMAIYFPTEPTRAELGDDRQALYAALLSANPDLPRHQLWFYLAGLERPGETVAIPTSDDEYPAFWNWRATDERPYISVPDVAPEAFEADDYAPEGVVTLSAAATEDDVEKALRKVLGQNGGGFVAVDARSTKLGEQDTILRVLSSLRGLYAQRKAQLVVRVAGANFDHFFTIGTTEELVPYLQNSAEAVIDWAKSGGTSN